MKRKRNMVWATVLCGVLLFVCPAAGAAVLSTAEATGGADSVYVAGNPAWYPVEYYDPDTKCYEGILPGILERIGERTGLNFTYVQAGKEDQRLRLAQNGQVEMVSGYALDAEEGLSQILCKHRNAVQIEQNLFKAEVAQAAAALFSK